MTAPTQPATVSRPPARRWVPVAVALSLHLLWLLPAVRAHEVARYSVPAAATLLLLAIAWRLHRTDPLPRPLAPIWWLGGIGALVVAGVGWASRDGVAAAAAVAASVLIAAAPAAVVGAGALTIAVTKSLAGRNGITLPRISALTRLQDLDQVVMDKHRTVTTGSMQITAVEPIDAEHHNNLLFFAGALAHVSPTPTPASAALARRSGRGRITGFKELVGTGILGSVDRHPVRLGRPEWIGLDTPVRRGITMGVEVDNRALGLVTLDDVVRPHAAERASELARYGPITLLSDAPGLDTAALAEEVGVSDHLATADAEARLRAVKTAQDHGRTVCFIGSNGPLNAPALDAADLVVTDAAGDSGSDVAHRPHEITLSPFDLDSVVKALRLSTGLSQRLHKVRVVAALSSLAGAALAATGLLGPYLAALAGLLVMGATVTVAFSRADSA